MAKATLAEHAFQTLRRAILDNEFQSGEKVSIAALKARYDIGTSPLREALARLVAIGLLECEHMKGYRVPEISMEALEDMYRARLLIELHMLKLAVEHITDEEEAELVAAAHQLKKIERCEMDHSNFCQWQQKHHVFISALMKGCHSPTLIKLRDRLYDQTERYRRIWFDWSSQQGHVVFDQHARDHQLYVDALVARDIERLQQTYKNKLLRWLEEMRQCLQDNE